MGGGRRAFTVGIPGVVTLRKEEEQRLRQTEAREVV